MRILNREAALCDQPELFRFDLFQWPAEVFTPLNLLIKKESSAWLWGDSLIISPLVFIWISL